MSRTNDSLLPASLAAHEVAYCIGLVSDTHAPFRLPELPAGLFKGLQGVDLILHAGDVGELWVLDQLSAIAPVIAVHGNDDSQSAAEILPYTQIVAVQETRILLWHSHYPDWPDELASRQDNDMAAKLRRITARANAFNARVAVFGHWHIPLVYEIDGILLINPGALASGNEITRQLHQTAAVLFFDHAGGLHPVHFNLSNPEQAYDPKVDINAGFQVAAAHYSATVLAENLSDAALALRESFSREEIVMLRETILPLAHRVWRGEQSEISRDDFTTAVAHDKNLPAELRTRTLELLKSHAHR